MTAVGSARAFGNDYFKKGDYRTALRKYRKSLRYLDVCWEKGELDEGKNFVRISNCKLIMLVLAL
jgi:peptidyl-prolyl isomerase D